MSYKGITKYIIFGDSSKKSSLKSFEMLEQKSNISEDLMDISPKNNINLEMEKEKRVTIVEYMNDKIEDPNTAIENLKKELEKSLIKYNG